MENMYRRWKRWAALMLALVLALSLLPATAAAQSLDEVTLGEGDNRKTYTVTLGCAFPQRDGDVVYLPSSIERGIISDTEEVQWDYYILLYDRGQDAEATAEDYTRFWENYDVTVSIEGGDDPHVSLTELREDDCRRYVGVTVTGPWSGRITVDFTPRGETSGKGGTGASRVSIKQAKKLELEETGDSTFFVSNAEANEMYYFYIDLVEKQAVTVSGSLSEGINGQINLIQGDNFRTLWVLRGGEIVSQDVKVVDDQLLLGVFVDQDGMDITGTVQVTVEQPALLYRNMRHDAATDTWYETGDLRDMSELNLEWGGGSYMLRLYYGTEADAEPVTDLSVSGDTLALESMTDGEGEIFWRLQGIGYGESTLNWKTDSESGDYSMFVDLPEYGFYSEQARDISCYLSEIVYDDLSEDRTVWLISGEGFTEAEAKNVIVSASNGELVETDVMPRESDPNRYDIRVTVPAPDINERFYLEAMLDDWYMTRCQVSLAQPGNALYWEDYAAGFSWDMGDILMINEGNWQLGQSVPEDDGSYFPYREISIAVGEKKTDAGGQPYYEVEKNMPVSVRVTQLRVEAASGTADAFSFDDEETVTQINDPSEPVMLYSRNDQSCTAVISAEVEIISGGRVVKTGTVRMLAWQKIIVSRDEVRPDDDTTDALNAYLAELADNLDPDGVYTIHLGKEYIGTIEIPEEFGRMDAGSLKLTGADTGTKIYGGIDINGGDIGVLQNVFFFSTDDVQSALYGGSCRNIYFCLFSGYDVAADATDGMLTFTQGNIFVDNTVAVRLDAARHEDGGNLNPWGQNTFLRNDTAVQVLSFNDTISPYYFRIVDSNFIGNDIDFDLQTGGTVYLYRNYFGKIHPRAENMPLAEYISALLSAGENDLHQLVTSNAPNIGKDSVAKGKVVTNPCWRNPVQNWWQLILPVEDLLGNGTILAIRTYAEGRSTYENYLTADWELITQIVNEEAGNLLMGAAAFTETEDEKQIVVVDQDEKLLGTWIFD